MYYTWVNHHLHRDWLTLITAQGHHLSPIAPVPSFQYY